MVAFSRCRMAVTGGLLAVMIALLQARRGPAGRPQQDQGRCSLGSTWRSGSSARNSRWKREYNSRADARDVSHCDQRHQPDVGGLGGDDGADLPITGGRRGSGGSFQGRAIPAVQHRLSSDRRVDHNASIDLLGARARLPEREVWNDPPPPVLSLPIRVTFTGPGPTTTFTFEARPELAASMPIGLRLQSLWSDGDTDIEPYLLVAVVSPTEPRSCRRSVAAGSASRARG